MRRVTLYLRVSTDDQTVANQRHELEAAAERHGWRMVRTLLRLRAESRRPLPATVTR